MSDSALEEVVAALRDLDPDGTRMARTLRNTLDQLYDGQHTGRYRWDQLHKTEKTHCGTLVEINLQRDFQFLDGDKLDFAIAGHEVDCKYSQDFGGWMIPNEAHDELCLVVTASDTASSWSAGVVRMTPEHLRAGRNRDGKTGLNEEGRRAIEWLHRDAPLPPNVLLALPSETLGLIFASRFGTQRINELFRQVQEARITRGVVATVAQQSDYMKRVRENGGARSALRSEGIVILGDDSAHQAIAAELGVPVPLRGEFVSVCLAPAVAGADSVLIDGSWWRRAIDGDPPELAPLLPRVSAA